MKDQEWEQLAGCIGQTTVRRIKKTAKAIGVSIQVFLEEEQLSLEDRIFFEKMKMASIDEIIDEYAIQVLEIASFARSNMNIKAFRPFYDEK